METDSTDCFVPKDLPVYSWHNKQEGKDQYARFVKEFISSIKHLRYLLEPGAVQNDAWANTLEPSRLTPISARNGGRHARLPDPPPEGR